MTKISRTKRWLLKSVVKDWLNKLASNGYQGVTENDVWEYLCEYRWKKSSPETIALIKEDIEKMTPNEFYDYQQMKAMMTNDCQNIDDLM
ncbi:post-transcriptional regulator [Vagococcus carniphilus]|uniref:post-transcriptional regulator n=1 Tax=Vagococcus carniphilus TaxID=218144 RepID=UPI003B5C72FE